jgi:hypothetical protein
VLSGTEGKASKMSLSKRGEGSEPAEEMDIGDNGLVEGFKFLLGVAKADSE